jgi:hypothetical protein
VDGAPNGICVPKWSLSSTHLKGAVHGENQPEFLDCHAGWSGSGEDAFQVHAVDATGAIVVARKLTRGRLVPVFAELAPSVVAMEACASAHHAGTYS